jgi:hypothetical protein
MVSDSYFFIQNLVESAVSFVTEHGALLEENPEV